MSRPVVFKRVVARFPWSTLALTLVDRPAGDRGAAGEQDPCREQPGIAAVGIAEDRVASLRGEHRPSDANDMTEPAEAAEPTENADAAEPIDPIEAKEPTEPIERAEPFEAIERNESSDHSESELSGHSSGTSAPMGENGTRRTSAQSPTLSVSAFITSPVLCQKVQTSTVGPAPEIVAPIAPIRGASSTISIERG